MKIKFDGRIYTGEPEEIVKEMNQTTFITRPKVEKYMKDFSRREWIYNGEGLRIDTAEDFIKDLENKGLVEIIK